jgi:hypothetical protein
VTRFLVGQVFGQRRYFDALAVGQGYELIVAYADGITARGESQ